MGETEQTATNRQQWEQLEGEPDAAYARFLVYRNLGPARSLDAAYQLVAGHAAKRRKTPRVSGQWQDDSVRFGWVERAAAWDIYTLTAVGMQAVIKWVNALDQAIEQTLIHLKAGTHKPRTWKETIDAVVALGNFIPAETVSEIRHIAESDNPPAIGRDGEHGERGGA